MISILIVDNEIDNFYVLELLLLKENYQLTYASNGYKALKLLETIKPDVILLDVMMPEINGIEVCQRIKSHPDWQHIPIIMVTALNSKQDLARCLEAGADDFLAKPVSAIELRARIRSMLRIKKQYDFLQETLTSLKAALQLREDMAKMIVHDLRNPLNNIFLFSELLLLSNLEETQIQKVDQVLIAAQHVRSLADDLLIMAKVESGKITLNPVDIDLRYITQTVIADFQGIANEKNIQLVSDLPPVEKSIFLDVNLFRRVLDNLLSNALKFAPAQSQIKIQVEYLMELTHKARIRVYDQGPGIKEELRQRIFEKYEIGNLVKGVSQIGLGLAFCKMVIEAHGGKIFVEPNQPQGSIFTVEI